MKAPCCFRSPQEEAVKKSLPQYSTSNSKQHENSDPSHCPPVCGGINCGCTRNNAEINLRIPRLPPLSALKDLVILRNYFSVFFSVSTVSTILRKRPIKMFCSCLLSAFNIPRTIRK